MAKGSKKGAAQEEVLPVRFTSFNIPPLYVVLVLDRIWPYRLAREPAG